MRRFPLLLLLGLLVLAGIGCDASDDESGTVTLVGQVLDAETNNPVTNAFVRIPANQAFDKFEDLLVETDEQGNFSVDIDIEFASELLLIAGADGYSRDQVTVLALADRTIEVPRLRITRTRAEDPISGSPSNLLLKGNANTTIGVIESGSSEVTRLTFQVADSAGRPVTLANETLVRFSLGQQPGGGEFIAPTEALTDNNGEVTVNLSSGTKAGVVQVIAETTTDDGRVIRSKPISVTIHGGHPDQNHFTLGPSQFNFPGLTAFGLRNPISVIVGDKYGNPVRPGTAVYFTTTHGVVEGSTGTSSSGQGSATLISANPLPPDGLAIIEAETADDQNQRVSSRTPVVFSGFPVIEVSPSTAILGRTYTLRVTDQNGNPLAPGNTISVKVEGTKVKATGTTNLTLDDTIITGFTAADIVKGPGITDFTFRAVEDLVLDEDGTPTVETITIRVSGPNGGLEIVLTAGAPQARTEGARVDMLSLDTARIQASH